MPISESELNQRVVRAQNLIIPQAQKAGRCLTQEDRFALTNLIRGIQGNVLMGVAPSAKSLTELAEWTSPLLEQAPKTAPPASKGLLEDLAKLSRAEFAETALAVGSARNPSPFWQRQARAAGQVSESAGAAPVRSREAREADYARAATLPLTEARELREALMAEFARTQPFGGRRLDQA